MDPMTERELKLTAQLHALRLFVISLVRKTPALRIAVGTPETLARELQAPWGTIPGQPELSDHLNSELQEAYRRLIADVLDTPQG